MQCHFKKCTPEDLETLVQISKTTFIDAFENDNPPETFWNYIATAFSTAALTAQLHTLGSHFYFAFVDDIRVGYFKYNTCGAQSDLNISNSMELERIYVLKAFQGKNIGTCMLHKVIDIAVAQGFSKLWLGVWEHNTDAIRFYERYGFVKFGEHPYAVDTDIQTDWLMGLDLQNV